MVELLDYHPYGAERISWSLDSGEAQTDKTYIGEYSDDETGLSYLNARYYDPDRGQFLSEDPVYLLIGTGDKRTESLLVDPQLQNSYSYARNNPILLKDPSGECPFCVIAALAYAPQITAALAFATTGIGIHFLSQDLGTLQSDNATVSEKAFVATLGAMDLFGGGLFGKVDDAAGAALSGGNSFAQQIQKTLTDLGSKGDSALKPTQDWIDTKAVEGYFNTLKEGGSVAPIEVFDNGGVRYIQDGHHRYLAGEMAGVDVPQVNMGEVPINGTDWNKVNVND